MKYLKFHNNLLGNTGKLGYLLGSNLGSPCNCNLAIFMDEIGRANERV